MTPDLIVLIAGGILPFVIDFIKRIFKLEDAFAQKLVSAIAAFLVALVISLMASPFTTWTELAQRFATVLAASQVVYLGWVKNSEAQKLILGK